MTNTIDNSLDTVSPEEAKLWEAAIDELFDRYPGCGLVLLPIAIYVAYKFGRSTEYDYLAKIKRFIKSSPNYKVCYGIGGGVFRVSDCPITNNKQSENLVPKAKHVITYTSFDEAFKTVKEAEYVDAQEDSAGQIVIYTNLFRWNDGTIRDEPDPTWKDDGEYTGLSCNNQSSDDPDCQ